jgi:energy-coupling factor transporter ATP-binding protein EcfA2
MDGRRRDQMSQQAELLSRALLEASGPFHGEGRPVSFGSAGLWLRTPLNPATGPLISSAFRTSLGSSPRLSLTVVGHDEIPPLPSLEWARPWIETVREIPSTITYPHRILIDRIVGLVLILDQTEGRAVAWLRHRQEMDLRSLFTPFRVLLSWLANLFNGEVIHASAAVIGGRALVLSGGSGSGKSTLALALGLAGHPVIADDCLLVEGTTVHSVFSRAKVDEHTQRMLGLADSALIRFPEAPRAKRLLPLDGATVSVASEAPLGAWGMPQVSTHSSWYRLNARRAHMMIATDSLREIQGGTPRNRVRLATMAAAAPAYRLVLNDALRDSVATACEVIQDATSARQEGPGYGV